MSPAVDSGPVLRRLADGVGRRFAEVARGRYPAEPVALMRIAGAAVALADVAATWRMAPLIWGPEQDPQFLGAWEAARDPSASSPRRLPSRAPRTSGPMLPASTC